MGRIGAAQREPGRPPRRTGSDARVRGRGGRDERREQGDRPALRRGGARCGAGRHPSGADTTEVSPPDRAEAFQRSGRAGACVGGARGRGSRHDDVPSDQPALAARRAPDRAAADAARTKASAAGEASAGAPASTCVCGRLGAGSGDAALSADAAAPIAPLVSLSARPPHRAARPQADRAAAEGELVSPSARSARDGRLGQFRRGARSGAIIRSVGADAVRFRAPAIDSRFCPPDGAAARLDAARRISFRRHDAPRGRAAAAGARRGRGAERSPRRRAGRLRARRDGPHDRHRRGGLPLRARPRG